MAYHNSTTQQLRYLPVVMAALKSKLPVELVPPEGVGMNTAVARCRDVIRVLVQYESIIDPRDREELSAKVESKQMQVFVVDGRAYVGDPKARESETPSAIALASTGKLPLEVIHAVSVLIAHGLVETFEAHGWTHQELVSAVHEDCQIYQLDNQLILSL